MLLARILPLIVGCYACIIILKRPNYDGRKYRYDLNHHPPLNVTKAPAYRYDSDKTEAIAEAFRHSWKGYYTYAFPKDTLQPLSGSFENDM